jgi:competence protein ComEC
MRKMIIILFVIFLYMESAAQSQVEIHQINVGNGDGALIKLFDAGTLVYTIVIDGGLKSTSNTFVPYLKSHLPDMAGQPAGTKNIDWVILSHNHQDHFNGLTAMLRDPKFIIRNITDQGGYVIADGAYDMPLPVVTNANCVPFISRSKSKKNPQNALVNYVSAVAAASVRSKVVTTTDITRVRVFDTTAKTFQTITLPTVGGTAVRMICIAGNAFTKGIAATTARNIGSTNPNNFSFGWILEFGRFRYYSGGDLGGYSGGYTDQETDMATYLKAAYTTNRPLDGTNMAKNYPGHVCVMKTNHHGSSQSSNPEFLKTIAFSAIITSAGDHKRWKLPTVDFINRVAVNAKFGAVQGVYFTQLYSYGGSLAQANTRFAGKPEYNYIAPTGAATGQYSFVFVVKKTTTYVPTPPGPVRSVDIADSSVFSVEKVRSSDNVRTAQHFFLCHKP